MSAAQSIIAEAVETPAAGAPVAAAVTEAPKPEAPKPEATQGEPAKATEAAPAAIEVKVPEGVKASQALLDAVKATAKDTEHAQKLVDVYAAELKQVAAAETKQRLDYWSDQHKQWDAAVRADPEIGGAQYEANMRLGQKFMAEIGSPELIAFLRETNIHQHPELVRLAVRGGRKLAEDSVAGSANAASPKANSKKGWYPNSPELTE